MSVCLFLSLVRRACSHSGRATRGKIGLLSSPDMLPQGTSGLAKPERGLELYDIGHSESQHASRPYTTSSAREVTGSQRQSSFLERSPTRCLPRFSRRLRYPQCLLVHCGEPRIAKSIE